MNENVAKTLKNLINRKAWKRMTNQSIDSNIMEAKNNENARDKTTGQEPPSQGTAEPPHGGGDQELRLRRQTLNQQNQREKLVITKS